MSDRPVIEIDGVEYTPNSAYLALEEEKLKVDEQYQSLQQKHSRLERKCVNFLNLLADEGIQRGTRRRRRDSAEEEGAEQLDEAWTLTKITGPGFSSTPPGTVVQVYRIDTNQQQQQPEAAASSGAHSDDRFLFRPRDSLELVRTSEVWSDMYVGRLENKV